MLSVLQTEQVECSLFSCICINVEHIMRELVPCGGGFKNKWAVLFGFQSLRSKTARVFAWQCFNPLTQDSPFLINDCALFEGQAWRYPFVRTR